MAAVLERKEQGEKALACLSASPSTIWFSLGGTVGDKQRFCSTMKERKYVYNLTWAGVGHCVHKALVLFFFTQLSSNVCFLSTDSNSILKQRKVRSSRWFPLRNAYPSFPLEWLRGQNKVYICPTIGTDVDRNSRHKLWTKVFFKTQPCMPLLIEQKNNNHICCCWSLVSTQYHEELKSNLNSENTHGVMVPNNS